MSFDNFDFDARIDAQIKAAGFDTPTPIQQQAIPVVLQGKDVIGLAQTGTGKTAAFMLPVLQRLTTGPLRRVRALVVAPTRELAEQIHQCAVDFGRKTKIRSVAVYGGASKNAQIDKLRRGAEIVVACPGRLLDLVNDGEIDLSHVEVLVLDEADRMCDMGFLPDIKRILKLVPDREQTLFFSATMPDDIRQLSQSILNDPETIQVGEIRTAHTISHSLYPITQKQKKNLLLALLDRTPTGRVLIFTRTKYRARNLARDLDRKGYRAAALQGNMSHNQRQRAIKGFRSGKFDILAATDVAARGIDVSEITHVINFDIPDTVDAYTHRVGRTGRAEQEGEAFTFATPDDIATVAAIERRIGETIEQRQLDGFDYGDFEPKLDVRRRSGGGQSKSKPKNRSNNGRSNGNRRHSNGNRRNGSSGSNGSSKNSRNRRSRNSNSNRSRQPA